VESYSTVMATSNETSLVYVESLITGMPTSSESY